MNTTVFNLAKSALTRNCPATYAALLDALAEEGDVRIIDNMDMDGDMKKRLASLIVNGEYDKLPPYESEKQVEMNLTDLSVYLDERGIDPRGKFTHYGFLSMKPYYNSMTCCRCTSYEDTLGNLQSWFD